MRRVSSEKMSEPRAVELKVDHPAHAHGVGGGFGALQVVAGQSQVGVGESLAQMTVSQVRLLELAAARSGPMSALASSMALLTENVSGGAMASETAALAASCTSAPAVPEITRKFRSSTRCTLTSGETGAFERGGKGPRHRPQARRRPGPWWSHWPPEAER